MVYPVPAAHPAHRAPPHPALPSTLPFPALSPSRHSPGLGTLPVSARCPSQHAALAAHCFFAHATLPSTWPTCARCSSQHPAHLRALPRQHHAHLRTPAPGPSRRSALLGTPPFPAPVLPGRLPSPHPAFPRTLPRGPPRGSAPAIPAGTPLIRNGLPRRSRSRTRDCPRPLGRGSRRVANV